MPDELREASVIAIGVDYCKVLDTLECILEKYMSCTAQVVYLRDGGNMWFIWLPKQDDILRAVTDLARDANLFDK